MYALQIRQNGKISKFSKKSKFNISKYISSIFAKLLSAVLLSSGHPIALLELSCDDQIWPNRWQNISGRFWVWHEELGQGHPKSRSPTWRRVGVHTDHVWSKSDHIWRSYMDLNFRVFGTKMGLWPWKVCQGRWKWVSILRSTWGPYLYRFRVCPLNFVCQERKKNNN